MLRTLSSQTPNKIGEEVQLIGWVQAIRSHGKISFIDLRDRAGVVQLVTSKTEVGAEDVVEVIGLVKKRPESMHNPNLPTGTVEIEVKKLNLITKARELPFPIDTDGYDINEEIRTKYRYLDLRRPRMAHNIRMRSKVVNFIRNFLTNRDFVEIETPILTKTTPEGARDFLVPSRLQQGKFYALPQSPQQYKQLLMVAGFERYFQIARCFRDEDPRRDRAYGEFTQLDLEMSFVTQEDILLLTEELFTMLVKVLFPHKHIRKSPWPRLSHALVMEKYGTDKPDLRENKEDPNELAFSWTLDFPLFTKQSTDDFYHGSGNAKFAPSHHMFTAPHPQDIPLLTTDPLRVRGLQHDLVLNGFEVGGGSVRIHSREIQEKVFELIGFSESQKKQFDHMLMAFTYGVPPHGGIAPGIDRLLMALQGEPNVREVMAFPTSASGSVSVMEAPSEASNEQLLELGIKTIAKANKSDVFSSIIELLDSKSIQYSIYEHKPVFTSEEASSVRNTPLHQGAKALIMIGDKKPLMMVLPADLKVNTKVVKQTLHINDLKMATAEQVEQLSGVKIGAVPPFGNLFGIPLYVDEKLRDNKEIVFNAGLHTKSILMSEADFEQISKAVVGSFT